MKISWSQEMTGLPMGHNLSIVNNNKIEDPPGGDRVNNFHLERQEDSDTPPSAQVVRFDRSLVTQSTHGWESECITLNQKYYNHYHNKTPESSHCIQIPKPIIKDHGPQSDKRVKRLGYLRTRCDLSGKFVIILIIIILKPNKHRYTGTSSQKVNSGRVTGLTISHPARSWRIRILPRTQIGHVATYWWPNRWATVESLKTKKRAIPGGITGKRKVPPY